jgi:hypothetical protein
MTIAPQGFGPGGKFGGALLVGNFGDSHVSAFDLKTGTFLGQLSDAQVNPLVLNGGFKESNTKGLWGIAFGNGQDGSDPNALFFAAGINQENDGLFGKVTMSDGDHDRDDGHGDRNGAEHVGKGPDAMSTSLASPSANVQGQSLNVSNGIVPPTPNTPASPEQTGTQSPSTQVTPLGGRLDAFSSLALHQRLIDQLFGEFDAMPAG